MIILLFQIRKLRPRLICPGSHTLSLTDIFLWYSIAPLIVKSTLIFLYVYFSNIYIFVCICIIYMYVCKFTKWVPCYFVPCWGIKTFKGKTSWPSSILKLFPQGIFHFFSINKLHLEEQISSMKDATLSFKVLNPKGILIFSPLFYPHMS